ncbi:MAG: AbrB/MazE/SpoVT family DNA-binding domain-containing protein [Nitrososphaerota archaeon]
MGLVKEVAIGKKYTIYLPKAIVKALNLKEGDKFLLKISGNAIIMEPIHDPIKLALSEEKFASIKPEEVELISLEEQEKYIEGSS